MFKDSEGNVKNTTTNLNSKDIEQEESKSTHVHSCNHNDSQNVEYSKKRGGKKGIGKELKDILEEFQKISGSEGRAKEVYDKSSSLEKQRRSKRVIS